MLSLYVGTYLHRSAQGTYGAGAWGLNGIKWYCWAPRGYLDDQGYWNNATGNRSICRSTSLM